VGDGSAPRVKGHQRNVDHGVGRTQPDYEELHLGIQGPIWRSGYNHTYERRFGGMVNTGRVVRGIALADDRVPQHPRMRTEDVFGELPVTKDKMGLDLRDPEFAGRV
jgi:hypothetical protein